MEHGHWHPTCSASREGVCTRMSFGIYLAGSVVLIVGLALGAHMAHVPPKWIAVGVLCLVGIGVLRGVVSTRRPDV